MDRVHELMKQIHRRYHPWQKYDALALSYNYRTPKQPFAADVGVFDSSGNCMDVVSAKGRTPASALKNLWRTLETYDYTMVEAIRNTQ